jgi:hypothetical protein
MNKIVLCVRHADRSLGSRARILSESLRGNGGASWCVERRISARLAHGAASPG